MQKRPGIYLFFNEILQVKNVPIQIEEGQQPSKPAPTTQPSQRHDTKLTAMLFSA